MRATIARDLDAVARASAKLEWLRQRRPPSSAGSASGWAWLGPAGGARRVFLSMNLMSNSRPAARGAAGPADARSSARGGAGGSYVPMTSKAKPWGHRPIRIAVLDCRPPAAVEGTARELSTDPHAVLGHSSSVAPSNNVLQEPMAACCRAGPNILHAVRGSGLQVSGW